MELAGDIRKKEDAIFYMQETITLVVCRLNKSYWVYFCFGMALNMESLHSLL